MISDEGMSRLLAQQANWAIFIFRCTKCLKLSEWGLVVFCGVVFFFLSFKKLSGAAEFINGPEWAIGCTLHGVEDKAE